MTKSKIYYVLYSKLKKKLQVFKIKMPGTI